MYISQYTADVGNCHWTGFSVYSFGNVSDPATTNFLQHIGKTVGVLHYKWIKVLKNFIKYNWIYFLCLTKISDCQINSTLFLGNLKMNSLAKVVLNYKVFF